ncbi:similarity to ribonucleoside diphosphate reductase (alpha chain) [Encephalitozoon cuniculi GB-M1]|uniref:Similarity to ribonucleoside diphosphate reductase (Alpha chain) n=2 Tax=Encephalitozoon cuniculi TaxID=6035 RepID=Q8SU77_ENCCU|nr:uncharacterized protein ECU11_0330 [Encephalitozoon cuniculi GB-M1]AGE94942.1 ribonucleoside diphosphate reductase [Encephalitozoon cuniculi]KMV64988.1 hypothetical protein M970_110270 [Encephalitozoon cuniculi EcunIII-L]UYI26230.1 putative PIN domain-containing protein [Encephalitozoon cuniculi]CAD25943.1 similarity to ribonucleoside diphosphate reductase (alpha chain) [Encephalitozoon cuniculi GB-M1]
MLRISIIPDTNVFISHLDMIKGLYEDEFPVDVFMSISRVVLRELDYNKGKMVEAREAIRFLEKVYNAPITELEGKLRDNAMDVVDSAKLIPNAKNNDDEILNFASRQAHPVILTSDKAFYLKSKCYNVESILVHNLAYEDLKLRILKIYTGVEPMDIDEDCSKLDNDEKTKEQIRDKLFPVVLAIMEKGIGKPYILFFPNDLKMITLDFLLGLIIKENYLFRPYLPRKSKEIVQNLRAKIKSARGEELHSLGSELLMLFRIVY